MIFINILDYPFFRNRLKSWASLQLKSWSPSTVCYSFHFFDLLTFFFLQLYPDRVLKTLNMLKSEKKKNSKLFYIYSYYPKISWRWILLFLLLIIFNPFLFFFFMLFSEEMEIFLSQITFFYEACIHAKDGKFSQLSPFYLKTGKNQGTISILKNQGI